MEKCGWMASTHVCKQTSLPNRKGKKGRKNGNNVHRWKQQKAPRKFLSLEGRNGVSHRGIAQKDRLAGGRKLAKRKSRRVDTIALRTTLVFQKRKGTPYGYIMTCQKTARGGGGGVA